VVTEPPRISGASAGPAVSRHSEQPTRRAANCSVTPWGTIPAVTAALDLAPADDLAATPVRRTREERQAIVLDTAERLFASRSSRSVGMDELVRETGLGKMTVYRLFKSKDDLVGAYLSRKAATVLAFIDAELVRCQGDPRAALLSVVDTVERDVTRTGFRGCPFTNVSSEYDDPQHPARSAAADYKFELHMRLERLADELIPGAGDDLAAQIHLIIDGMYLSGGLLGPDGPASHGRQLAEKLIDAAIARA
jgi:AcrR family transcriptional regulator